MCFFFSAFSSSSSALRESTMLPRFLLTLMTRMRSSCPRSASRLRTGTHVDLRAGEERADADVDGEPALDALDDAADDDLALGVGLLDLVPDLHLLRFFAGEDDVAFAVFGALEQDVDDVAGLHGDFAGLVEELGNLDDAFGLVADVDDDFRRRHLENGALDDLAFRDVPEAVIVDVQQPGVFVRIDLVVVVARPRFQRVLVRAVTALGSFGRGDAAAGAATPPGRAPGVFSSSTFAMPYRSSWSIVTGCVPSASGRWCPASRGSTVEALAEFR